MASLFSRGHPNAPMPTTASVKPPGRPNDLFDALWDVSIRCDDVFIVSEMNKHELAPSANLLHTRTYLVSPSYRICRLETCPAAFWPCLTHLSIILIESPCYLNAGTHDSVTTHMLTASRATAYLGHIKHAIVFLSGNSNIPCSPCSGCLHQKLSVA